MSYISVFYLIFVFFTGVFYFIFPRKQRYFVLLIFSALFIGIGGVSSLIFLSILTLLVYLIGIVLERRNSKKLLITAIILVSGILIGVKYGNYCYTIWNQRLMLSKNQGFFSIWIPIGISFYTLQMMAYLIDIWKKRIQAETNLFKFFLFIFWFPHILQGPIARYQCLSKTLYQGALFDYDRVTKGIQFVLWGFFKKLVIADRAYIIVDEVFTNYNNYGSLQIIFAAVIYAFQLYSDFSGCVDISIGVSEIFDIKLDKNFEQPYFAVSIKDFWRRWHLSLSSWLRDYIYIPLGGSRNGKIKKYRNIFIVFLISGVWHGVGVQYIVWGMLHGIYQIVGDLLQNRKNKIKAFIKINWNGIAAHIVSCIITFLLVDFAWIFFRADSLKSAMNMLKIILVKWNPWVLFDGSFYQLGLDQKEIRLLIWAIILMLWIDYLHERMISVRNTIAQCNIVCRWCCYFILIFAVIILGKYGYGFQAADFIYMQF